MGHMAHWLVGGLLGEAYMQMLIPKSRVVGLTESCAHFMDAVTLWRGWFIAQPLLFSTGVVYAGG